jgi:citrate lyase subunit beta/citryl-CoA lyase
MITGLRRSSLYVPGDVEKMLRKATMLPADQLLLNLEDGVAASRKAEARANVARALGELDFGRRERVVRINSLRTELGRRDLAEIAAARPDGICLPKVESGAEVLEAAALLADVERDRGLPAGTIRLHAMIESARGVVNAAEIASTSPRMAALVFGSADFVADLRCRPGPERRVLEVALQQIVLAARAGGVDAIDAPCFDLADREVLRREAEAARRLGFDGKSALRPDQLEVINRAFDVTAEETAWARSVLEELDRAERGGRSLTTLDGRMIDDPHRIAARRILEREAQARGTGVSG